MNHLTVRLWNVLTEQDSDFLTWMNSVNDNTNSSIKTLCDGVNDVIDNVNTINTTLINKVDKVVGKGLSSNDYTTDEKVKLQGVKDGATKTETSTTNGNVKIDGVEKTVYTHPVTHAAGMIIEDATRKFVTDAEKNKIDKSLTVDSIMAGANVTINKDTVNNTVTINSTGGGGSGSATWDTTTGKPFNTVDATTLDTTNSTLKVKDNVFALKVHNHDGSYQPTGDYVTNEDITNHNTNVVAHTDIRSAIPTKTSQLTNDSNYATTSQIPNISSKADKTYVDTQDALKIDKTQIKNTLTETTTGNVLDATQGKIIDDKITVLSNKSIAYRDEIITDKDFNTLTSNGTYGVTGATGTNKPPYDYGQLIVTSTTTPNTTLQMFIGDARSGNRMWFREKWSGVWTNWVQLATTEKIEIPFPFNSDFLGLSNYENTISKDSSGKCTVTIYFKKKDGTDFSASPSATFIATFPSGFMARKQFDTNAVLLKKDLTYCGSGSVAIYNGGLHVYTPVACNVIACTFSYNTI